jgi:RNA polymerase sigma factor (sigma-70 family)
MEEAQILRDRIDDLEDQLTGIRAQRITDMPRGGQPMSTADLIAKKVDLLNLYERDLKLAEEAKLVIDECIRSVDSIRDRTILSMKYVDGMSYARIAEVLNYSSRQIKRINKNAVENMKIIKRCPRMSQDVTSTM